MADKKTRKKSNSIIIIFVLLILIVLSFILLFSNPTFWFKKSIHEDAKKYTTKHCLVFYPNNDYGKKIAKEIAEGVKDDAIYD